jgi:GH35 family endo-1,4-beta-xylanase
MALRSFLLLLLLVGAVTVLLCASATRADLPAGGESVLPENPLQSLAARGEQKNLINITPVSVSRESFDRALRVSTSPGASAEWNAQLQVNTASPIKSGDVLLAHLWLRCAESMTGDGFVGFVMELAEPEFDKAIERRLVAGSAWRECFVPFVAKRDYAAGEAQVNLRLGYDRQTIEIGGLELINYANSVKLEDLPRTKITYTGREEGAPWRKEALARIEKIRKADLLIRVTDESGKPLAGAKVRAAMTRHAFGFGSAITADLLTGDSPDAKRYQEMVEKNFNLAVFENDMKWPAVWTGVPRRTDQALDWLLERHIQVRGHNLVWPSWRWLPQELRAYRDDKDELRRRTAGHITATVSHLKGKLFQWDVVNEPFSNHDLIDALGGREVLLDWFKLARQADPACRLYLNDYGIFDGPASSPHRKHFFDTLTWMKESRGAIDGIGIQSHFSSDLPPPTQLLAVLDEFSALGLPIESTEVSFNVEDRPLHADYMRDYLIALFSHENVHGVMLWGFWEGRHWRPQAALFARDLTPRPVWAAWNDLVNKQWKTEAEAVTDDQGVARVRGFCGEYDVATTIGGKALSAKVSLVRAGSEVKLTVK